MMELVMMLTEHSTVEAQSKVPADLVIEIPIDRIFNDEKRKKRIDPKDEKNQQFLMGVESAGLINAIDVRPVGEKFELICGRRRLWAAKTLGWKHIAARVGEWSDDEVLLLIAQENALRRHLTPVQQIRLMQDLMKLYEKVFGEDPGRRLSGWAGARAVQRDPVTRKFVSKPVELSPPGESQGVGDTTEPLIPPSGHNGVVVSPDSEQSHSKRLQNEVGQGLAQTYAYARLAKTFTDVELDALGTTEQITKKALDKLAKIEDREKRAVAINLVAMGQSVDSAIAHANPVTPVTQKAVEDRREEEMPDLEWVESFCKKKRDQFQNPEAYDRSAFLYRHTRTERAALRARTRKEVYALHQAQPTSFTSIFAQLLYVAHPRDWFVCGACLGMNVDDPDCRECRGTGFKVKVEWPERNK
jgi:ParB-like nuclease domain